MSLPEEIRTATYTLVSLHAHPDDEALLTGGTLARAAAEGHRVVLVVATLGEAGLTSPRLADDLGERRRRELEKAAHALGVARVVTLGYADSGSTGDPDPALAAGSRGRGAFSCADVEEVAQVVAGLLRQEGADVLTSYDRHGGYGHPDHLQVHRVGRRAAEIAGTPVLLEATVDRELLQRALRLARRVLGRRRAGSLPTLDSAYTTRPELTHCVDVRPQVVAKRRALRAHASQAVGGGGIRTMALLLRLPQPVARRVLGREWFVQAGRPPSLPLQDDVFASLRTTL